MAFTKDNQPEGRGRPKGAENQKTRDIKEVVNYLVEAMNDGFLDEMLIKLSEEKPEALLAFIGKIAPKDLNIHAGEKVENAVVSALAGIRGTKSETD